MATAYHCELAWLGGEQSRAPTSLVDVDGDRIAGVTAGVDDPPAGAVRLRGLTVPGFANAHSHAFHRALRGRTQRGTGSFWTWRRQMYDVADRSTRTRTSASPGRRTPRWRSPASRVVGEFHYLHHAPGGAPYDDAERDGRRPRRRGRATAGMRITLLDTCYLHGGIGAELDADAAPVLRRRRRGVGGAGARTGRRAPTCASAPPSTPCGPSIRRAIAVVAAWAAERGAPLHAHVSEQPAENEQTVAAHGCTPTQLLAERGALGERFTAVHATHLTDRRHRPARRRPLLVLLLPDDRARPRRRHRSGAGRSATPAPA